MGNERLRAVADINLRIELQRLARQANERDDGPVTAILAAAIRTLDERLYNAEASSTHSTDGAALAISLICRNVRVKGRRTSVKLEKEFWTALEMLADRAKCTIAEMCDEAWLLKGQGSLTSALRVLILRSLMDHGLAVE